MFTAQTLLFGFLCLSRFTSATGITPKPMEQPTNVNGTWNLVWQFESESHLHLHPEKTGIETSDIVTVKSQIDAKLSRVARQHVKHIMPQRYRSAIDISTTSMDTSNLPACMNVTLDPGQFTTWNETGYPRSSFGYKSITVNPSGDTNHSVTICFSLSPQLLTCQTIRYSNYSQFHVENHTLYLDDGSNATARLGDYFITEQGDAILCKQAINYTVLDLQMPPRPRCNNVIVEWEDCEIISSQIWRLKQGRQIITRADLLVSPDLREPRVVVCFPLSLNLLNCNDTLTLEDFQFHKRADHRISSMLLNTHFDVGDFYFSNNGAAVVCNDYKVDDDFSSYSIVYTIFRILSVVCLLVILALLLFQPVRRRTYQSKCLACHIIGLIVMLSAIIIRNYVDSLDNTSCFVFFVVTYLATMSSFFWIHVLSFDVCRFFAQMTFSRFRWCCLGKLKPSVRMCIYCVYAYGTPLLFLALAMALEFSVTWRKALHLYPDICHGCWFHERNTFWVFYYGPLLVIMASNLVFFIFTLINICHASKGTEEVNNKKNQRVFMICVKLYVVMGLCWWTKLINWIVIETEGSDHWYAVIPFTSLQGVAIFTVYMCKKKNIDLIRRKLNPRRLAGSSLGSLIGKCSMDTQISTISQTIGDKVSESPDLVSPMGRPKLGFEKFPI